MDIRAARRMNLERICARAVEREEFGVHYRPKVLLETGAVAGVEGAAALAASEKGLLEANQFIQLTEKTGLINQINAVGPEGVVPTAQGVARAIPGEVRPAVRHMREPLR